jgi:protoporphyrinogen oxidase
MNHGPQDTSSTVVVGGGLVGLVVALLLGRRGHEVTVVEGGPTLGGLLSSVAGPGGTWFDHGTHVPQETGVEPLDELLFAEVEHPPWRQLPGLRAGCAFNGVVGATPAPDLRTLGGAVVALAERDLLEAAEASAPPPRDAREGLRRSFGRIAAERALDPAVASFFGTATDQLVPEAHHLLFRRVTAFSAEDTVLLKARPAVDEVLAFHAEDEVPSSRRAWYPSSGGAGRWIEDLCRTRLAEAGARFEVGVGVVSVGREADLVREVVLADGRRLPCDRLVWTVPAAGYLRAAGIALPDGAGPPRFRTTVVHHLLFDRVSSTELDYVTVLDPDRAVFRFTNYPALRDGGPPSASVEVVLDEPPVDVERSRTEAVQELVELGLLEAGTEVTWATSEVVANGFPVPTLAAREANRAVAAVAEASATNVAFAGRSTGQAFFMADVLADCWSSFGS